MNTKELQKLHLHPCRSREKCPEGLIELLTPNYHKLKFTKLMKK